MHKPVLTVPVHKLQLRAKMIKTVAMMRRLVMSMGLLFVSPSTLIKDKYLFTADFRVPKLKIIALLIAKTFLLL